MCVVLPASIALVSDAQIHPGGTKAVVCARGQASLSAPWTGFFSLTGTSSLMQAWGQGQVHPPAHSCRGGCLAPVACSCQSASAMMGWQSWICKKSPCIQLEYSPVFPWEGGWFAVAPPLLIDVQRGRCVCKNTQKMPWGICSLREGREAKQSPPAEGRGWVCLWHRCACRIAVHVLLLCCVQPWSASCCFRWLGSLFPGRDQPAVALLF